MVADGQADETIITKFIIDTADALTKAKQFRAEIDAIKVQLKELAKKSSESLRVAAKGMLEQFKSEQFKGMTQEDFGKTFGKDSAQYQTAIKNIQEYRAALVQAMQETSKEFRAASTEASNYQKAIATATNASNFQTNVNAMKSSVVTLAKETGKSFKEIVDGMKQAFATEQLKNIPSVIQQTGVSSAQAMKQAKDAIASYNQVANTSLKQLQTEYKNTEKAQDSWSKSLLSLGNVIKGIFIGLIYNVIMGILRGFTQLMSEATQYAYDLTKGVFQLELGIRALRRSGIDVTFADTVKQIRALREEFGIFTTRELVEGTAAFYNLIRDLGFTREEIEKLQRSIVTLAIVNGRSMDDVQKTVALALSSGYTEGLQRLGVSINRVNIAQQAARMGWEKGYMALTEQQRAAATLVLLNQKVAKYSNDVAKYQASEAGQIDVTSKRIEEQSTIIGQKLLPMKKAWLDIELKLILALGKVIDSIEDTNKGNREFDMIDINPMLRSFIELTGWIVNFDEKIEETKTEIQDMIDWARKYLPAFTDEQNAIIDSWTITKKFKEITRGLLEDWKEFQEGLKKSSEDIEINVKLKSNFGEEVGVVKPEAFDLLAQEIELNFKDTLDDIFKVQEEFQDDSLKAWEDYKSDLAEIDQDYNDDLEDAAREHYQELDDIAREFAQDIADAITSYNSDVLDAWTEYYDALEDAAYDYRQADEQAEKDYQEDLLRLREQFLFDLEDALQARDARAVLNLIRRYNLEKEQAKRSYEDEKEQNRQQYEDSVRDAQKARERRLAELDKELAERLAALALQNAREIEEERIKYERQLEEERINWERRRSERSREYALELADLVKARKEQLKAFAQSLIDAGITAKDGMENLRKVLEQYLGEGGLLDDLWSEYEKLVYEHLDDINTVIDTSLKAWSKSFGKSDEGTEEESSSESSSTESNKGTTTSPAKTSGKSATDNINSYTSTDKPATTATASNINGRLAVEINLSEGLESSIVDEAMNGVADVLLRSTKR